MKKKILSGAVAGAVFLSTVSQVFAGVSPIDYGADTSVYFDNAQDLEYVAAPEFREFPGEQIQKHDSAYTFMLAEGEGVTPNDAKKHYTSMIR